jgi:hypothetical protein
MNARSKRIAIAAAASLLAVGGSKNAAAQEPPTAAKNCVYLADLDHTKIVNERNILFYLRNGKILQNALRDTCYGLHEKTRFTYGSSPLKRLCTGDMITLIADLSFGGVASANTCKLGMFLPVNDDEVADLLATASKDKGGQKKRAIKSQPVELPRNAATDAQQAPAAESTSPATPRADSAPAPEGVQR